MRAVVVGAGAMGSTFAAALARAGNDIVALDAASEVVGTINQRGIEVVEDGTSSFARVPATSSPSEVGPVEVAIVFVKAHHTQAVAGSVRRYLSPNTVVASLQNGWGNADVLAKAVPPDRLVVGVTYHSCTLLGPGRAAHTGRGPTMVGPYEAGGDTSGAEKVAELLSSAGFEVAVTPGVRLEIWKKLVLNAATLPVAGATGLRAGELADSGEVQDLVDALAAEAVLVANKLGLGVDLEERLTSIHKVLAGAGSGKPSMLQDIEARRKTEIEVINGVVARAAAELGLDVPLNRAMTSLVHGIERSWAR